MRKAINVADLISDQDKKQSKEKGIEFTHYQSSEGWQKNHLNPSDFKLIIYLGKCTHDGDVFAAYNADCSAISIYKGHLNNGTY